MSAFFDMGGYAVFVWTAYGLTAAALVTLAVRSHILEKRTEEEAASLRRVLRGKTKNGQRAESKS